MDFCELGLCDALLCAIRDRGFEAPTPLQEHVIPEILGGRNVRQMAPIGAGKTAAYLLPLLQRLMGVRADTSRPLRAIVLVPDKLSTHRVLASMQSYGIHLPFGCETFTESATRSEHLVHVSSSAGIIVGTPAGLAKASARFRIYLGAVELIVLDDIGSGLGASNPLGHVRQLMLRLPRALQTVILNTTPIGQPGLSSDLRMDRLRYLDRDRIDSNVPGSFQSKRFASRQCCS